MSDIDTVLVDSLKALDPKRPIREADVEYHDLDKGEHNFLSADGPLLKLRSDRGGSRQRTAFMRVASTYFHGLLGKWRDDWVADLANVGFPDHDTTIDMVRSARRGIRP